MSRTALSGWHVEAGTLRGSPDPGCEMADRLIRRVQALRDADRAVLELIALGPRAVPALRRFLFRREPSGIYQPRCDAVAALAGLKAEDVLLDFLRAEPEVEIADPVERTGEDAVINAAARALKHRRDDAVFDVLMRVAEHRRLAGVIEALGETQRPERLRVLIDGLFSDFTRPAAEEAIRKAGLAARSGLIAVALSPMPSAEYETTSSLRTRRSAVGLLCDIAVPAEEWSLLSPLMKAADPVLASRACHLALATGQPLLDREEAVRRLIRLLTSADWLLAAEIEGWLAEAYDETNTVVNRMLDLSDGILEDEKVRASLLRVTSAIAQATAIARHATARPMIRS
jgi:hypothetical protein